jgi:hypothetical protein
MEVPQQGKQPTVPQHASSTQSATSLVHMSAAAQHPSPGRIGHKQLTNCPVHHDATRKVPWTHKQQHQLNRCLRGSWPAKSATAQLQRRQHVPAHHSTPHSMHVRNPTTLRGAHSTARSCTSAPQQLANQILPPPTLCHATCPRENRCSLVRHHTGSQRTSRHRSVHVPVAVELLRMPGQQALQPASLTAHLRTAALWQRLH